MKIMLLVEDSRTDEKLTLRAFKKHAVANQIDVARDGEQALAYLFDAAKPLPTVVILDLKLPKLDGLEVLRRLRATPRTRLVPVVVLTSSKEQEDLIRSYSLGANAYVRKPVDFSQFAEAAKTLGLFWMLLNETAPA
jgi:two-component system response regulator